MQGAPTWRLICFCWSGLVVQEVTLVQSPPLEDAGCNGLDHFGAGYYSAPSTQLGDLVEGHYTTCPCLMTDDFRYFLTFICSLWESWIRRLLAWNIIIPLVCWRLHFHGVLILGLIDNDLYSPAGKETNSPKPCIGCFGGCWRYLMFCYLYILSIPFGQRGGSA